MSRLAEFARHLAERPDLLKQELKRHRRAKRDDQPSAKQERPQKLSQFAAAVIGAGMIRRGEAELPPAKMSDLARNIVNSGRKIRGEPLLDE